MNFPFYIGAGHSNSDPGVSWLDPIRNKLYKEVNIAITLRNLTIEKLRILAGPNAKILHDGMQLDNQPLTTALALLKLYDIPLPIEWHMNGPHTSNASGVEVISSSKQPVRAAQEIAMGINSATNGKIILRGNNGHKFDREILDAKGNPRILGFCRTGLKRSNGLIIETGFIRADGQTVIDYIGRIAESTAGVIYNVYKRNGWCQ